MDVLVSCHVYKGKNKLQIKRVLKLARLSCGAVIAWNQVIVIVWRRELAFGPGANKLLDKCFFFLWVLASFVRMRYGIRSFDSILWKIAKIDRYHFNLVLILLTQLQQECCNLYNCT